ncbi:MAG: hypothetical protein LBD57_01975 [Endomicrobium sp.]|jgi:hypothetical protein|uniref:hypothetical protein n=1 Tax=Candidatus Endomicrobiellum cubanum TaxID=3242325 RepID=UPI002825E7C6|nr:hypothetical protein [Endomicrobium sp.]
MLYVRRQLKSLHRNGQKFGDIFKRKYNRRNVDSSAYDEQARKRPHFAMLRKNHVVDMINSFRDKR